MQDRLVMRCCSNLGRGGCGQEEWHERRVSLRCADNCVLLMMMHVVEVRVAPSLEEDRGMVGAAYLAVEAAMVHHFVAVEPVQERT